MPLFGQGESSQDAGQNSQLLSLSQRLIALEAVPTPTLAQLAGEPAGTAAALITAHQTDPEPHNKFTLRMKCGTTIAWGSSWRGEVSNWVSGGGGADILQALPNTPLAFNTLEPYIYRHERSADSSTITYNIPVRKAIYKVRLHFCENFHNNINARVMATVKINDITVLTNFDILKEVAKYSALIKEFNNIDCTSTAICKIALSNGLINGIEIIQSN